MVAALGAMILDAKHCDLKPSVGLAPNVFAELGVDAITLSAAAGGHCLAPFCSYPEAGVGGHSPQLQRGPPKIFRTIPTRRPALTSSSVPASAKALGTVNKLTCWGGHQQSGGTGPGAAGPPGAGFVDPAQLWGTEERLGVDMLKAGLTSSADGLLAAPARTCGGKDIEQPAPRSLRNQIETMRLPPSDVGSADRCRFMPLSRRAPTRGTQGAERDHSRD